jgi:hypothetical protein
VVLVMAKSLRETRPKHRTYIYKDKSCLSITSTRENKG